MSAQRDFSRGFRIDGPPDMSGIARFSEPPPSLLVGPGTHRRIDFINALRARPGEWAEYLPPEGKAGWAGAFKSSLPKEDRDHIEVTQRTIPQDRGAKPLFRIWARWVP